MTDYRKPPTYVRNDALTPGNWNQLARNAAEIEKALRTEHVELTGEHNTPLIARTLGTVKVAAGPTYSLEGFNGDASLDTGHNPSVGKLILTLARDRYETNGGPLVVQNASTRGDGAPCLSWARWFDDTRVEVYSAYWSGTLGSSTDGHWNTGGDDGAFHLGVHSRPLQNSARPGFGDLLVARQGLRGSVGNTYANQLIQGAADLELALRVGHADGVHDVREVAKAWAHVQYNGAGFDILDQEIADTCDAGEFTLFDIDSPGAINCIFDSTFAGTGYQVFVDVDYSRLEGSSDDYVICCAPADERSNGSFFLYFYKKFLDVDGIEYFDRTNEVDFFVWVHDNH